MPTVGAWPIACMQVKLNSIHRRLLVFQSFTIIMYGLFKIIVVNDLSPQLTQPALSLLSAPVIATQQYIQSQLITADGNHNHD